MNKRRRESLREIITKMEEIKDALEEIKEGEEECQYNMPENLQGSERYEKAEAACESLYDAIYSLDEAVDYVNTSLK